MRVERTDVDGDEVVVAGKVAPVRVIPEAACVIAEVLLAPINARTEPPNVVIVARAARFARIGLNSRALLTFGVATLFSVQSSALL